VRGLRRPADAGPNAEQIRYWNDEAGPKWVAFADRLDGHIEPLGRLAMERAGVAPGERVLDVGCGCGQSTLLLGERVGRAGRVTGIDVSARMLEEAVRRARRAGATHLDFQAADAQTAEPSGGPFDLAYSRFGVMFFQDPPAAFANLRRALRPDGRLAFVCWQPLAKNPWLLEPLLAAGRHLALPAPPEPGAPGPFSLGDPERLRGVLGAAGYTRIEIEDVETQLILGGAGGVEEATRFLLEGVGPTSRLLEGADAATRDAVADAMGEVLAARLTPDGVRMGCAVWVVVAR
jgi:SAM-dependent methyltransferase